ncbi:MAG: bifunctional diaminohydroxyphosphoribosylaminopyrimidine deaminase/5-amino-6-(5-phosphoribosylamino)uracil reductase RibD [Ginsengibacter sp.]
MSSAEQYMNRCLQLAKLGAGNVAPNPMVGAVLVYDDIIIGEGYHEKYGGAHAEVNCLKSVKNENRSLIAESTMYVSLEPCSHYGKTPPCADLIIKNKIKKVVIGIQDIYKEVSGAGIQKLQDSGAEVLTGVLENECRDLNKRFFTFHQKQRPYIILKWAQSANGKIGSLDGGRVLISNGYSNRLVHKWRSEEASILVGTNTVLKDNPSLTTRLWNGNNPVRIVIDRELKLSSDLKIFDNEADTVIFNSLKNTTEGNIRFIRTNDKILLPEILHSMYELRIQSVLIEGGTKTLQSFIDAGLWDEARIITNEDLIIENGIGAPQITNGIFMSEDKYCSDSIKWYEYKD